MITITQADATKIIRALRANGWCQHVNKDADGRMCVRGAIVDAVSPVRWNAAQRSLRQYLNRYLVSWNDDALQTFNNIITTLMTWRETLPAK